MFDDLPEASGARNEKYCVYNSDGLVAMFNHYARDMAKLFCAGLSGAVTVQIRTITIGAKTAEVRIPACDVVD